MKVKDCQICVKHLESNKEVLLLASEMAAAAYNVKTSDALLAYVSIYHSTDHVDELFMGMAESLNDSNHQN